MIIVSFLLVLIGLVTLLLGILGVGDQPMQFIYVSIAASLIAAVLLIIGIFRARPAPPAQASAGSTTTWSGAVKGAGGIVPPARDPGDQPTTQLPDAIDGDLDAVFPENDAPGEDADTAADVGTEDPTIVDEDVWAPKGVHEEETDVDAFANGDDPTADEHDDDSNDASSSGDASDAVDADEVDTNGNEVDELSEDDTDAVTSAGDAEPNDDASAGESDLGVDVIDDVDGEAIDAVDPPESALGDEEPEPADDEEPEPADDEELEPADDEELEPADDEEPEPADDEEPTA